MPRLKIDKYIKVLGDFYDRNFTAWRTVSRFSINADYEAIELESFQNTLQWFEDFSNSDPSTYKMSLCAGADDNSGVTQLTHA